MIKCPHPWMHQVVTTDDKTMPCCMAHFNHDRTWKNEDYKLGLYNPARIEMREQMRNGEWPDICKICKDAENNNLISYRKIQQRKFPLAEPIDYSQEDNLTLKYLDIKYTNKCNLACRMCKPTDSSLLAEEFLYSKEWPKFMGIQSKSVEHYELIDWDKQARDKVEYTKQLVKNGLIYYKVTGGEPMACKYFMECIDWIIENDYAKNMVLFFTTNGIKFNKTLMNKLIKFKQVNFTVSIDATEKIYDYIRHHGSWDKIQRSMDLVQYYKEKYPVRFGTITVSCILQFYNLFNIAELADWTSQYEVSFNVDSSIKPDDSELNVEFLPPYLLHLAKEQNLPGLLMDEYKTERFVNVLNSKKYNKEKNLELLRTVLLYDKKRNQSYRDFLYPEQIKFLDDLQV